MITPRDGWRVTNGGYLHNPHFLFTAGSVVGSPWSVVRDIVLVVLLWSKTVLDGLPPNELAPLPMHKGVVFHYKAHRDLRVILCGDDNTFVLYVTFVVDILHCLTG